jgi:hypothetical protein
VELYADGLASKEQLEGAKEQLERAHEALSSFDSFDQDDACPLSLLQSYSPVLFSDKVDPN